MEINITIPIWLLLIFAIISLSNTILKIWKWILKNKLPKIKKKVCDHPNTSGWESQGNFTCFDCGYEEKNFKPVKN